MSPEDIKKLLGGYATGTLTAEEQEALFAAALEDQELFDALAREQSLRDLLRDPAARAELLGALDTPVSRAAGFWQWLRRPMMAPLAVAAVAEIALVSVAVWKGTHVARPAPVMVAELKRPEAAPALPQAPANSPAGKPADAPVAATAEKKVALPAAPLREPEVSPRATIADRPAPAAADNLRKDQIVAGVPPPPPAPAAAAPVFMMARKAEADATASGQLAGVTSGAIQKEVASDARAIFYANQPAPAANAFVAPGGGGGAAPPAAKRAAAAGRDAAPRLGVRVSILRGTSEADLATVLNPGETVRLRLTPNADGFLYVAEGARVVASGAVQRLRPFETPELRFEGSEPRQLYLVLSRSPQAVETQSLGTLVGGNLTGTSEGATFVVSGSGAQQVVVRVTLTYR
jgi:hypothetical protein